MSNDTTLLFELERLRVAAVELDDVANPVLALVTDAETARCCPACGAHSKHPHWWVCTRPRDLPATGLRTTLNWTKRRWRCANPACARVHRGDPARTS